MVAPRPVKDFSSSANPLNDMHQSYVAARARMEAAGRGERVERLVQVDATSRDLTRAAYLDAMSEMRRGDHSIRSIVRVVAAVTGVSVDEIRGDSRPAGIALARMIAVFIAREETDSTFGQIGQTICRDQSTVRHGYDQISDLIKQFGIRYTPDIVEMSARLWATRAIRTAR